MTALTFPRSQGRYVLLKELGRGAMGQTFLAVSLDGGVERLCVLKAGLPGLSAPLAQRLEEEARVLAGLSFEKVVGLYEMGTTDGHPFIAMEFVHGRTIEETLAECRAEGVAVPVSVALLVGRDLARALNYLHTSDLKVLHRDVAAANVMLAFSGDVKLIDFGLAKSAFATDMTAPGIPQGHGAYLAPERLLGKSADARADIFSAGVILWELLTGQSANTVPGWDEGMSWKVPLPPPSTKRPSLGPGLDKLVGNATAIDPAGRFRDAGSFRRAVSDELAVGSPGAETADLAGFLGSVFGGQIVAERQEIAHLLHQARAFSDVAAATPRPSAGGTAIASPHEDARIGELLGGKYLIQSRCGQGGMGEVFVAIHHEIGRRVAIKILRETFMGQPDVVLRFKREMLAIGRIDHPNVVAITDAGVTADGCLFYVMEFVDGESLKEALARRGAFPVDEALRIAQEIAAGVEGAHALGIVHRDLKPANVMLCARPLDGAVRAKVLDFGIAKDLRSPSATLTHLDRAVGSPDYMAPEQARGLEVDFRSDVYAFGAVLFEMLCRRPPFVDNSPAVVVHRKLNEDPPAPGSLRPEIPRPVDRLVLWALSRDPAQRPQSMKEMRTLLSEALEAGRHAVTAPITAPILRGRHPGRLPLATATIALGAVGLGAVGLWYLHDRPARKPISRSAILEQAPSHGASAQTSSATESEKQPEVVAHDWPGPSTPSGSNPRPRGMTTTTEPRPDTDAPATGELPVARSVRRVAAAARMAAPAPAPAQADGAGDAPSLAPEHPSPIIPLPRAGTLSAAEKALASGDFPSAALLAQKALDSRAPEKEARLVLGQAEFMLTRYREADEQFRRVLEIDPANTEARAGLKSVGRRLRKEQ